MEDAIADALNWNRMDTDSSQLESPLAWVHIDNQVTRTTEANPSQCSEESQVCGSTSKTARGEAVKGLKTVGLESDTVRICYLLCTS
jgi:hypothetical protein